MQCQLTVQLWLRPAFHSPVDVEPEQPLEQQLTQWFLQQLRLTMVSRDLAFSKIKQHKIKTFN